ncbi:MAG: hypothetical protein PHG82_03345 [Candidatus Gracilibacteria bacterium]|nr:hypothetical protein [Candidatus Gracilibacteria bacterium]
MAADEETETKTNENLGAHEDLAGIEEEITDIEVILDGIEETPLEHITIIMEEEEHPRASDEDVTGDGYFKSKRTADAVLYFFIN